MQVFHAAEVPKGARVLWDNGWWTVADIRRHALTTVDNTVWMILDGYKAYGRDQPLVLIDTPVWVDTSFT